MSVAAIVAGGALRMGASGPSVKVGAPSSCARVLP